MNIGPVSGFQGVQLVLCEVCQSRDSAVVLDADYELTPICIGESDESLSDVAI